MKYYKYYYDTESNEVVSIETIKKGFEEFKRQQPEEYNCFDEYLSCCMLNQNGTLETLQAYIAEIEDEITKILYTEFPLLEKADREEIDARLDEIVKMQQYL